MNSYKITLYALRGHRFRDLVVLASNQFEATQQALNMCNEKSEVWGVWEVEVVYG